MNRSLAQEYSLPLSPAGALIAAWGVFGVLLLLTQAIVRLGSLALEAWHQPWTPIQAAVALGWVVFNAYGEGYRAFQKRFSPRVVARALYLAEHPKAAYVALAPLFCMAFFHASRRAQIIAWSTTTMVVTLIVIMRRIPQPWRGIVDLGVVVALIWGAGAIVYFFLGALALQRRPPATAALPEPHL